MNPTKTLRGTVTQVIGKDRFVIREEDNNGNTNNFSCYCKFFCPIHEGDSISCSAKLERSGSWMLTACPLVIIGRDRFAMEKLLIAALKISKQKATTYYNSILEEGPVYTVIDEACRERKSLPKLSPSEQAKLRTHWHKQCTLRQLYLFGLNKKEINDAIDNLGLDFVKIQNTITNNHCFRLTSLPLDKCVEIHRRLGSTYTQEDVYCATIARKLYNNVERGWTGTPSNFLVKDFPNVVKLMDRLKGEYGVVAELHTVYLKHQHDVELEMSRIVIEMVNTPPTITNTPPFTSLINTPINTSPITTTGDNVLGQDQLQALELALSSQISIITGGAGTGKTTLIKEIVHNLELQNKTYILSSFTGKAVSRLCQTTQKSSVTIHRFLTFVKKCGGEYDQLEDLGVPRYPDYIIIDESSMVFMDLVLSLLHCARRDDSVMYPRIVFVGDVNQLPPIQWGSLFQDLLESGVVPTAYLSKNRRVYEANNEEDRDGILLNSSIVLNYDVESGPMQLEETNNFTVVEDVNKIETLIKGYAEAGQRLDIITPFNKDLKFLNLLSQKYNSKLNTKIVDGLGVEFHVNDRVMMTSNNYKIDVMNGEDGLVIETSSKGVLVRFREVDGLEVNIANTTGRDHLFAIAAPLGRWEKIDEDNRDDTFDTTTRILKHSFAITIHNSQGSEYDFVAIYIPASKESSFLNKHLLYTAMTRAKRQLYLVGDVQTFITGAVRKLPWRCSKLKERLEMSGLQRLSPLIWRPSVVEVSSGGVGGGGGVVNDGGEDGGWEEDECPE